MTNRRLAPMLIVLGLAVGGCATTGPGPGPDPGSGPSVSGDGFAGLTVLRSSVSDVETSLGLTTPFSAPQTEDCSLHIWADDGLAVTTTAAGTVLAFVMQGPEASTPQGIAVGSTAADLDAAYGSALTVIRRDSPAGGPVVLVDNRTSDESSHLAFDLTADGDVARIRVGALPWVGYADYCSDEASRPESTGWPL
ncbi:hypothetical protein GCM10009818_02430 [Nakamurella flavida]